MTATNKCYNFVGFRYSPPLKNVRHIHTQTWLRTEIYIGICTESLHPDCLETVNFIIYNNLVAECILHAALHTQGAIRASQLTGMHGGDSVLHSSLPLINYLAISMACFTRWSFPWVRKIWFARGTAVGQRICSCNIYLDDLGAFFACRLIPLKECPGVRPIGVGKVLRQIIAKAFWVTSILTYKMLVLSKCVLTRKEAVTQLSIECINFPLNSIYKGPYWLRPPMPSVHSTGKQPYTISSQFVHPFIRI